MGQCKRCMFDGPPDLMALNNALILSASAGGIITPNEISSNNSRFEHLRSRGPSARKLSTVVASVGDRRVICDVTLPYEIQSHSISRA